MAEDESKYRVERPEDTETEKKGLFRPLPEEAPVPIHRRKPTVQFLGMAMPEDRRDLIVMFLMPVLAAIIDTSVYAAVMVQWLPDSALYMFVLPVLAAAPIGMTASQLKNALVSGILAAVFFVVFFILFLISPSFMAPDIGLADFFVSSVVIAFVYFLFVTLASLLGCFVGILLREFF
ncbi:MAG: hypothetical protein DRO93_09930 [Candidatus Thorarchaeota archaeon]|nr:MAG: hypothetical protein DRO93_09930 [Candidatus Thorarchaeota archaeon]